MKPVWLLALLLWTAMPLPVAAAQTLGGGTPILWVAGKGSAPLTLKGARIAFEVTRSASDARSARGEVEAAASRIARSLARLGVDAAAVGTTGYQIVEHGREYRASEQLVVKVPEIGRVGSVLDALVAAGGSRVTSVRFLPADPADGEGQAIARAVDDARRKARALSAAAGVSLGRLLAVRLVTGSMETAPGQGTLSGVGTPGQGQMTALIEAQFATGG